MGSLIETKIPYLHKMLITRKMWDVRNMETSVAASQVFCGSKAKITNKKIKLKVTQAWLDKNHKIDTQMAEVWDSLIFTMLSLYP